MNKRWFVRLGAALIVLLLAGVVVYRIRSGRAKATATAIPPQSVAIARPAFGPIRSSLRLTGTIEAIQQAAIYSRVSGYIQGIPVNRGDQVTAGQVLVVIEHSALEHMVQSALAAMQVSQGNLARDQANLENARVTFNRTQPLAQQGIVSASQLDDARAKLDTAQAQVTADQAAIAQTRAQVNTARANLGYATITAPFAGIITQRNFDPGAFVTGNTSGTGSEGSAPPSAILQLSDENAVRVFVYVQEKDLASVRKGESAELTVDSYAGQVFRGRVTRSASALDPTTRAMQTEIDIPNSDIRLRPGMYARVSLITGVHPNAMAVPSQAVQSEEDKKYVFLAQDGHAHRVEITTGNEDGERTEVLRGLKPRDEVIVIGANNLTEGAPVAAQPFAAGQ